MKDKNGILQLGAGVYSPLHGHSLRINPGGIGITRDNNRAELVAIQQALAHSMNNADLTIYTDSLCSLQLINMQLFHPGRTKENKHRDLLQDIARRITERHNENATTRLIKVRSHSGIKGNDGADILAKEAAGGTAETIGPITTDERARLGLHWPTVQPTMTSANGDPPPRHPAHNLTKGIKDNLPRCTHLGQANTGGIYSQLWEKTNPHLLSHASNHFWKSSNLKWWQKMQIHKARWGRLWNKKLAYRYKRPYGKNPRPPSDDRCPICHKAQDGASHILAGCSNPVFKGMYINRHNKAVQLIQKAIAKGTLGGLPVYMDAGTCEASASIPNRPPAYLKPSNLPTEQWNKYRPDILLLNRTSCTAYLVEVGYCSDTNHDIKFQEKGCQHTELKNILLTQGFTTVHYLVFTVGTTGTIPTTTLNNLTTLGISRAHADKLISKIHDASTASCTQILATRRMKESLPPGG
jgi:ribonuclease HI